MLAEMLTSSPSAKFNYCGSLWHRPRLAMLAFSASFQPRRFGFQLGALRSSSSLVGTETPYANTAPGVIPGGTYHSGPRSGRAVQQGHGNGC